ncbi:hypothetical protein J6590_043952 [Homalodisca vitripennis]|nr:hypothetical protein J6590_043952 [Homalodisca vitripennis]
MSESGPANPSQMATNDLELEKAVESIMNPNDPINMDLDHTYSSNANIDSKELKRKRDQANEEYNSNKNGSNMNSRQIPSNRFGNTNKPNQGTGSDNIEETYSTLSTDNENYVAQVNEINYPIINITSQGSFLEDSFNMKELHNAIYSKKKDTSPGLDGVTYIEFVLPLNEVSIVICTDSLSAIMALENCSKGHKENGLIMMIFKLLVETQKRIYIQWIPGHIGIHYNERVDKLAKEAANDGVETQYLPVGTHITAPRPTRQSAVCWPSYGERIAAQFLTCKSTHVRTDTRPSWPHRARTVTDMFSLNFDGHVSVTSNSKETCSSTNSEIVALGLYTDMCGLTVTEPSPHRQKKKNL